MKWVLVVIVLGSFPVKTNLSFDSLDDCLQAEDSMRTEYTRAFNKWLKWARENPADSGYPSTQKFMQNRIGLESFGTCVPDSPNSN